MINHLEGHPHAFLDSNNIVLSVCVFDGHESELLEQVKEHLSAVNIICCCDYGPASKKQEFRDGAFYDLEVESDTVE